MEAPATHFPLEGDILQSESTCYLIMDFNGEGRFGKVAKCLNLRTNEVVAIKVLKEHNGETDALTALQCLDPDKVNVVRFIESFSYLHFKCGVFEMLDKSISDMLNERKSRQTPVTLNEIRPVIHQLMVALDALHSLGIMHADLKPDNVMLVDQKQKPYKIKLIDFGQALPEDRAQHGMTIQPRAYRAPEVYLGLPLTTAVDMWAVGCLMAQMYFGATIFPNYCEYNWMKTVINMLGPPEQWTLSTGMYTDKYFIKDTTGPGWRLRTPAEYQVVSGTAPHDAYVFTDQFEDLEHAVMSGPISEDPIELKDRRAFLSLLQSCLRFDPVKRITPEEALSHPFFTVEHLEDDVGTNEYADAALHLMCVCRQPDSSSSDRSDEDADAELSSDAPAVDVPNPHAATSPNGRNNSGGASGSPGPLAAADSKHVTSDAEVKPDASSADGAADAGCTAVGDHVTSAPDGAEKTPSFNRVRRLFGRARKGMDSMFQYPSSTVCPRKWSAKVHPAQDASPPLGHTHADTTELKPFLL